MRENEHTLREGHTHGHAWHASEAAGGFGYWIAKGAPPTQGAVQKYGRAEKLHLPSFPLDEELRNACAAKLVEGRGDVLLALAVRAWCWNEACESSEVRLRMTYSHTIRYSCRDRLMLFDSWKCTGALTQWILWALQVVVHWS